MKDFIKLLQANKQYRKIIRQLQDGNDCTVNGLWGSSASFFIAALASEQLKATKTRPRILLVVPSVEEAEEDMEDLKTFLDGHAELFPAGENIFPLNYENEGDVLAQRLRILNQIQFGNIYDGNKFDIIVTPIQALLQAVPSPKSITKNILRLQRNHEYPRESLVSWLQKHHYQLTSQVENYGEYALRGGIVDIFPYASDIPYRIEYFGDEIESIRRFNIESQQSEQELDSCQILSLDEMYETNALQSGHEKTSLVSYLNNYTWIVLKEPASIEDRARKTLTDANTNGVLFTYDEISSQFSPFVKIILEKLPLAINSNEYTFHVKSVDNFPQNIQEIASEFNTVIEAHTRTLVFCNNVAEEQRFREIIHDLRIESKVTVQPPPLSPPTRGGGYFHPPRPRQRGTFPPPVPLTEGEKGGGGISVRGAELLQIKKRLELRIGHLSKGFQFSDIQIAILAHHEIFHRYKQRREVKKPIQTRAIDSFLDLKKRDYVVQGWRFLYQRIGILCSEVLFEVPVVS